MELTAENFDKLLKKATSLEWAISEERGNQKGLKKQLEENQTLIEQYQAKEKEEQEKDAKKKGKYEELLKEKETTIKELQEKAEAWETYTKTKQEKLQSEYEELTKAVPEEISTEYADIMESLDIEKRVSFLKKMSAKSKINDFGTPPKTTSEASSGFQLLNVDAFARLTSGQRKDYFKKSKDIHWEVMFSQE